MLGGHKDDANGGDDESGYQEKTAKASDVIHLGRYSVI